MYITEKLSDEERKAFEEAFLPKQKNDTDKAVVSLN